MKTMSSDGAPIPIQVAVISQDSPGGVMTPVHHSETHRFSYTFEMQAFSFFWHTLSRAWMPVTEQKGEGGEGGREEKGMNLAGNRFSNLNVL